MFLAHELINCFLTTTQFSLPLPNSIINPPQKLIVLFILKFVLIISKLGLPYFLPMSSPPPLHRHLHFHHSC